MSEAATAETAPEKSIEQKLVDAEGALAKSEDLRRGLEKDVAALEALVQSRNGTVTQLEFRLLRLMQDKGAAAPPAPAKAPA